MAETLKIPLNVSTFADEEIQKAIDVLQSGFYTMGKNVFEFEESMSEYLGVKNAIFVNSGSSANLLALFAMANWAYKPTDGFKKIEPGSEVLVPSVTWSTSVWPIIQAGAVPVLVDCNPNTLQVDVEKMKASINERTVGMVLVHILGNSVDLNSALEVAKENKLWVIEDTCESLGTKYNDKFVGTFGDIGTYSFYFSHHISTIEGGLVVTDNDELAEIMRAMRSHGWTRHLKQKEQVEKQHAHLNSSFLFVNMGFNLRPTEINAAIGKVQLKKLESFNKKRREVAAVWLDEFKSLEGQLDPMRTTENTECTWFGFPVLLKNSEMRDRFKVYLEENGIETRPIVCGNLARQPVFENVNHKIYSSLSGADAVMDRGIFWGSHPMMTEEEVKYVSIKVKGFFK